MANYNKEQIKEIIEKSLQISQKNHGSIPLNSIEQATTFASYIAGFPSWNHYKKSLESQSKQNISFSNQTKPPYFDNILSFNIEPIQIFNFENSFPKTIPLEIYKESPSNPMILSRIPLGFKYNHILKQNESFYLDIESSVFIGNQFSLFTNIQSYLKEQNQTILFFHHELDQKNNSSYFNPLAELLYSDIYHDIFSNYSNHLFLTIWFELIQYLVTSYHIKITAEFLINSLNLEFLTSLLFLLVSKKNQLNQILLSYFKSLSIQIQKNSVTFSIESQKKHYENILPLQNLLFIFQKEYDKKTFSYDAPLLSSYLNNKKSAEFYLEKNLPSALLKILNIIIEKTANNYKNKVEKYQKNEHCVFFLSSHENLLNKPFNDYCIVWKYTQTYNDYSEFYQIVFLQHKSFIQPPEKFLLYFYQNTPYFEDNLFFSSGQKLIQLSKNECYLWKKNSKNDIHYFLSYQLVKLNIKNK